MADRRIVEVIAAVIEDDGRFLLARRLPGSHLAGLWEFPGGKREAGETEEDCLTRELREELDVDAVVDGELLVTEHAYPERTVRLHFRKCRIAGTPRPMLGQELRWVPRHELGAIQFPEADRALVDLLRRPPG